MSPSASLYQTACATDVTPRAARTARTTSAAFHFSYGMIAAEKAVEGVVVGLGVSRADEGARQVRAPPDAFADVRPDGVHIDRVPVLDEFFGHPLAPGPALLLAKHERRVQVLVLLVHEEREDVDVVLASPLGRDLSAGDQLDAEPIRLLPGLGEPLQAVVVGQREGVEPGPGHPADEGGRGVEAVRDRRVAVEIDFHERRIVSRGDSYRIPGPRRLGREITSRSHS